MSFSIDKQTMDELNLLGKFRQGSVYGLFNKVKTRGGEQLLNRLFMEPLENADAVNERSAVLKFFQQNLLPFPFDVQQVGLMRDYLDGGTGRNRVSTLTGMIIKSCLSTLTRDERYKKIIQGVQATIVTLNTCRSFAAHTAFQTGPYSKKMADMRTILSDDRLKRLMSIDIYRSLPVQTIAAYDHLLKGDVRKEMQLILDFIAGLDVFIAVATVARAKSFSYAHALPAEANVLAAEGLCHPCLEGAIGNTLTLKRGSNVMFLTGANMAGKSTLMKAVGINLYLAQMGFPVAASNMQFSIREGLYSSINVADNINLGYSHFYAEVVRVKQAAEAAASGKKLLLMFDELFKGTNVKDAYDGTLAVTEAFAEYGNCLFIVSTHIIEVGEALKETTNIQFVYMPTIMEGVHPRYTYKMKEGITEDRQGMMIIRNEGILEMLRE